MKTLRLAPLALGAILLIASCDKKDKPAPNQPASTPEGYVYYSNDDTIFRIKASGGTREKLFINPEDRNSLMSWVEIKDIAIDPTSGKLVILTTTPSEAGVVFVGNRDGSGTLTKIADGRANGTFGTAAELRFLAITAANGKVYIECDYDFVGVVNVDGSGATKLHEAVKTTHNGWLCNDLAVDPVSNTLYSLGDTAIWKISVTPTAKPAKVYSDNIPYNILDSDRLVFRKKTEELFFTDSDGFIYKIKTDGTGYSKLPNITGGAYNIAVDEETGELYTTNKAVSEIIKIKPDGTKLATVTAVIYPESIAYY